MTLCAQGFIKLLHYITLESASRRTTASCSSSTNIDEPLWPITAGRLPPSDNKVSMLHSQRSSLLRALNHEKNHFRHSTELLELTVVLYVTSSDCGPDFCCSLAPTDREGYPVLVGSSRHCTVHQNLWVNGSRTDTQSKGAICCSAGKTRAIVRTTEAIVIGMRVLTCRQR